MLLYHPPILSTLPHLLHTNNDLLFPHFQGLTKESVEAHGLPLAEALALLRANLPPTAILVGQNILKDVQWLQVGD